MGWRERLGVGQSSSRPSVRSSWPTGMEARGSKIDIVRAATVAAAGEPIDVSYITEALVAQEHDAPFHEDVPGLLPELYGEDANAVIALYGGPPILRDLGQRIAVSSLAGRPLRLLSVDGCAKRLNTRMAIGSTSTRLCMEAGRRS